MSRIIVLILGIWICLSNLEFAVAQGCLSLNQLGYGYTNLNGFYRQGPDDCALASDTNSFFRQGAQVNPDAGADYGMPPLVDTKDATDFLKICMAEKGVFAQNTGTDVNSRDYESELARCNALLYGKEFEVKRIRFNFFNQITKAQVNILNSGLEDGCIAILDYQIYPGNGISLPRHAVEFEAATSNGDGETTIDFFDPNFPEAPFSMTTGYNNQSMAMDISDHYRSSMGIRSNEWISLSGITLKCPIKSSCAIRALKDLEEPQVYLSSTNDFTLNQ